MLRGKRIVTWTLVGCGVLAFVALVIAGFTSQHNPGANRAASRASVSDIGRAVILDDVAFEVTSVRRAKRVRRSPRSASEVDLHARGVLVAVDFSYKNVGEDPTTAFVSDSSFLGGDGKTYGLDFGGATISNLQAGASGRARFVFDVRAAAVRGGRLLLTDCSAPLLDVPEQRCAVDELDLGLE